MATGPKNLDLLCIEVIGKHIRSLSRDVNQETNVKYCKNLGEKLIYSSISNSFLNGLDEKCFQFIFNNFHIQKFKINKKLGEKIDSLIFLDGKHLKKLYIFVNDVFYRKNKNIKITVDELNIFFYQNNTTFLNFFTKLVVNKKLIIKGNKYLKQSIDIEKNIINILENSTNNLEYLEISISNLSEDFYKSLTVILSRQKHLRHFRIENTGQLFSPHLSEFLISTLENIAVLEISLAKNWVIKEGNEILRLLNSLEELNVSLFNINIRMNIDEINNLFSTLQTHNSKNLRIFKLSFMKHESYKQTLCNFLQSCKVLEKLSFIHTDYIAKDFCFLWKSIESSIKHLKVLHLKSMHLLKCDGIKSLKYFLSNSNLSEIELKYLNFYETNFEQFLLGLKNLKNSLNSLSISKCHLGENGIELLSKSLENFTNLKVFFLINRMLVKDEIFSLFKSLQSSRKKLEKIFVECSEVNYIDSHPNEIYEFFQNCDNLKSIRIKISIVGEELINEYTSLLIKFSDILEELDIYFIFNPYSLNGLTNFLSKCKRLKRLYCNPSPFSIDERCSRIILESLESSKYSIKELIHFQINNHEYLHKFPKVLDRFF